MEDPIRIGDKEYKFDDMPPEAQKMVTYITTIDKQLNQMHSQMEILQVSREGCYTRLNNAMENEDATQEKTSPAGGLQENPDAE